MSTVTIRRETDADIQAITDVVTAAFAEVELSDQTEAGIVEKLRDDNALSVSLIAVVDMQIVGHVAASPVRFDDATGGWFGIGPVSVAPEAQRMGVGTALMNRVVEALREGGAGGAVIVGDPDFYIRLGFAHTEFLTYEGVPDRNLLAMRLSDSRFPTGQVHYHPAFG